MKSFHTQTFHSHGEITLPSSFFFKYIYLPAVRLTDESDLEGDFAELARNGGRGDEENRLFFFFVVDLAEELSRVFFKSRTRGTADELATAPLYFSSRVKYRAVA